MSKPRYTTDVGDYLIIWVTGATPGKYIAEVTQSDPLQLKVEETGPYACLRSDGDFTILRDDSETFQKDCLGEGRSTFLESEKEAGRKVLSGLKSLGITDGKIREIYP